VGTAWVLTVRGAGGLPVASITPSSSGTATVAAYYHHDVMGSTVAATEPGYSGAAAVFTYSEFGVPGAGSGGVLQYTYAGYRYDPETGLYYVHARYYNPNLGRFLQTDPIGTAGGANLYAYVGNDPINLFDPTGLSALETGNDSNGFAVSSPQNVADLASGLRLVPVTDTTPGNGLAMRDVLYQIQYADGSSYRVDSTHPDLYVSELITVTSGVAPNGDVPTGNGTYTSNDPQGNTFMDGLGNKDGLSNASYLQSFIVSTTSGVNPPSSAPIIVQYGGRDYGTIAVNISVMPPSVTTNGLKVYPMSP
jgi:RHS repeat-associated protein